MLRFREVESTDEKQMINKTELQILNDIVNILKKHKSSYNLVLNPLLDKVKFN